ncbi:hypothetical protein ACFLTP_01230 [Chloroflexota bacterium]
MSKAIGKIKKPTTDKFKKGRKLYFIPMIYRGQEAPAEYLKKFEKYWYQVEEQICDLELKLGKVNRIYHELIPMSGDDGIKVIEGLNTSSYLVVKNRVDKGARIEAAEDSELLTQFMDWSRCLAIGLQNQTVFTTIYESYTEANKKRNEYITRHLDETLKADEIGILFIKEGHQIQFPSDLQVFYIAPPALDEILRWLRDWEAIPPDKRNQGDSKADDGG